MTPLPGDAAPVLAQAAGRYHERPAALPLREHFECTWRNQLTRLAAPGVVILPDGCIDLLWVDGSLYIAGPDSEAQVEALEPGATVFGFRFRPAAASAWLGVPAWELLNRRVPLEDVWGRRARRLAERIGAADGDRALVRALESALGEEAPARPVHHPEMAAAYRLIAAGAPDGTALMPWLATELAISERTLRRRSEDAFGYGPKTLERVLRFQRFLQRMRAEPPLSPAGLAVETGYADQPHLVRESRRLAAATPRRLAELLGVG